METRFYPGVEADTPQLATDLQRLFDEEDFDTQIMNVAHSTVLQTRRAGSWRELTGLSSALTVKITGEHAGTRVEIGMQKWFDKAAVAAVALIVQPWLLALPALGAYWQNQVTEKAWEIIEAHIANQAGGYVPPTPGRCGNCGTSVNSAASFCSTCGADLRRNRTCSSCGAMQRDSSAKYCFNCGKPVG